MNEPVRHVILDANILAAHFCPASVDSKRFRERASVLLNAATEARWPSLRLYTPGICIAETIAVLDKFRFCTWHGPLKTAPKRKLSARLHKQAKDKLMSAVGERIVEQLEHEPAHVLLASLVSPVNYWYQYRRKTKTGKSRVKPPMGAADCVIAGMAILQGARVGAADVVLVTADQRLADVMVKCRGLTKERAADFGLDQVARKAGLEWNPAIYPHCVNLRHASDDDLREALLGWPLPQSRLRNLSRKTMTEEDGLGLESEWRSVSDEHGCKDVDRLAYTPAIDDLRTRMAVRTGGYVSNGEILTTLLGWRKAKKWPSNKKADTSKQQNPTLYCV